MTEQDPATYKQVKALEKFNVPNAENYSKADAIMKLGELFGKPEGIQPVNAPVEKPGLAYNSLKKANGNGSMYASYAKDIFCVLAENYKDDDKLTHSDLMHGAIELVKQAKEAFE